MSLERLFDNSSELLDADINVSLLGKTGTGKSSLANLLMGRNDFEVGSGTKSCSVACKVMKTKISGSSISVMDTPGLKDTRTYTDEDVMEVIYGSLSSSFLKIDKLVFVIRLGRFTEEEVEVLEKLMRFFGTEAEGNSLLVITGCEMIDFDNKEVVIQEFVDNNPSVAGYVGNRIFLSGGFDKNANMKFVGKDLIHNVIMFRNLIRDEVLRPSDRKVCLSLILYHRQTEVMKHEWIMSRLKGETEAPKMVSTDDMTKIIEMYKSLDGADLFDEKGVMRTLKQIRVIFTEKHSLSDVKNDC